MKRSDDCPDHDGIVEYLYGESRQEVVRAVEQHLAACSSCSREVRELQGVRQQLSTWPEPEPAIDFAVEVGGVPRAPMTWWHPPIWAQALAASLLIAAAGAGLANLDIRFGPNGLTVRTGWRSGTASMTAGLPSVEQAPWRPELAAVADRLRREFGAIPAHQVETRAEAVTSPGVEHIMGRVRSLVADSEEKQRRELAVRLVDLVREIDAQRRLDLVGVQQGFDQLEGRTGAVVAQQRDVLDYLVKVSQRR